MADAPKHAGKSEPGYEVGWGRPPKHTQFKKGQKSANPRGRPRGSKNRNDIEKLLDQKIVAGHDERGRPITRKLRDLINRALVQAGVKGDLKAIRMIKEYEFRYAQMCRAEEPDADRLRTEMEKAEERKILSAKLVTEITLLSDLKHFGIVETGKDGKLVIASWAGEAAAQRARSGGPTG